MSKAREIAEERLAKGEISEEEFDTLIKKISNQDGVSSDVNQEKPEQSVGQPGNSSNYIWSTIGGGLLVTLLMIGYLDYHSGLKSHRARCAGNAYCLCGVQVAEDNSTFLSQSPIIGIFFQPNERKLDAILKQRC